MTSYFLPSTKVLKRLAFEREHTIVGEIGPNLNLAKFTVTQYSILIIFNTEAS